MIIRLRPKQCAANMEVFPEQTDHGQALVLLPLSVLQPLHQLGVAQQVPVQWAVFGQAELHRVLGQGGALVMALRQQHNNILF